jgi:hypothetical protein
MLREKWVRIERQGFLLQIRRKIANEIKELLKGVGAIATVASAAGLWRRSLHPPRHSACDGAIVLRWTCHLWILGIAVAALVVAVCALVMWLGRP